MISKALQKGTLIYIYNQKGEAVTSISIPQRWVNDGLTGFDTQRVYVRKGNLVYAYNENGRVTERPCCVQLSTRLDRECAPLMQ